MPACLEWVTAQHGDPTSAYAGAVDLERIGASGHSPRPSALREHLAGLMYNPAY